MDNFAEIDFRELRFFTVGGRGAVNAEVVFSSGKGVGPEIVVGISDDVELTDTVEQILQSLAEKSIRHLQEVSALPAATIQERIRLGLRSYDDRPFVLDLSEPDDQDQKP